MRLATLATPAGPRAAVLDGDRRMLEHDVRRRINYPHSP